MIEQMRLEEQEQRRIARENRQSTNQSQGRAQDGYLSGLQRQVQERTERLNFTGDTMDRLEENSSNFADDVDKFISTQKKRAALGCKHPLPVIFSCIATDWNTVIGSKFGF